MKNIFAALLTLVYLEASSQCASQTVINNTSFNNVEFYGGESSCPTQQLNLPLVAGVLYNATIVGSCGCQACNYQNFSGTQAEAQVWAGWDSCNETQLLFTSPNESFSGTYTFSFYPNANYTYISIEYYVNSGWNGGLFCRADYLTVNSFSLTSTATPLVVTTQVDNEACAGGINGGIAAVHATGYTPFTYSWSNGQTDSVIHNISAGTYYVTVTDSHGCIVDDSVVMGQMSSPPTATIGIIGDTLTSQSAAVSYQWYLNGIAIASATSQNYIPLQNGNYYDIITNSYGCSSSPSNIIYIGNITTCNTTPFVSIYPPSASICSGGYQVLTLIGNGASYSWSNGSTATQITLNPTTTTTYSVTASDGNCTATASASITVTNSPSFGIYPTNPTICSGVPVILTASASGTAYSWSGPNNFTGNTASVSINATGQYGITVANPSGCTGNFSTSINVVQGTPPTISAGQNQTISLGDTANLIASVLSGQPPYTYSWSSNPAGFTSSAYSAQVTPPGTTTYNLTVSETDGCAATASAVITIAGTTTQCDTSIHPVITAIGCSLAVQQYSGATYQWEQNGAAISNATTAFYNVTQSDYYTCSVEIGTCTYFSNNAYFTYNQSNCIPAAVPVIDAISQFAIMPNPSTGEFTISFEIPGTNNAELKIFSTIGQLVLSEELGSVSGNITKQINLKNVAEGIYILQLRAGDKMISRKIVVE